MRLRAAQLLTRPLPPIISGKALGIVYPRSRGQRDVYRFRVRAQTGSPFVGTTGDFHAHRFGAHGYSEWRLWAVALALCSTGDTIVEIGANVGTETVGYSDIVGASGRVVAFEPLPANVEALHEVLSLTRYPNVTILPYALGDMERVVAFAVPPKGASLGTGHVLGPNERRTGVVTYYDDPVDAQVIEVQCRTLDSFADLETVALISCDAEGSEAAIVRGARGVIEGSRPALVLEASPTHQARAGSSLEALHAEVARLGYRSLEIARFSLREPNLRSPHTRNWLCLPPERLREADLVQRCLRRAGFSPCVAGLNPLRHSRRESRRGTRLARGRAHGRATLRRERR